MNKKILLISLVAFSIINCKNILAHEENTDFEKRDDERQEKSKQKDRETWDDFMNAVKAQEAKPAADTSSEKTTEPENKHSNHH